MSSSSSQKQLKKRLRRIVHVFSVGAAGIAAITLPGEDVIILRIAETLLVAYLAFAFDAPFVSNFFKGIGISGACTWLGLGACDVIGIIAGGTGFVARPVVAAGLMEMTGLVAIGKFSKTSVISEKVFELLTVQGFIYDLKLSVKLFTDIKIPGSGQINEEKGSPVYKAIKQQFSLDSTVKNLDSTIIQQKPMSPFLHDYIAAQEKSLKATTVTQKQFLSPALNHMLERQAITKKIPQIMNIPGYGNATVYGRPYALRDLLDFHQGDNAFFAEYDCGVVSVANTVNRMGYYHTENDVLKFAMENNLCTSLGETTFADQLSLLKCFCKGAEANVYPADCHNKIIRLLFYRNAENMTPEQIGKNIKNGMHALITVNSDMLWYGKNGDGSINHTVAVVGSAFDAVGKFLGLYIADSGNGNTEPIFVDTALLNKAYTFAKQATCILVSNI